ncbi:MAG TPA: alpha/beta fold hydrolase [Gemmatimonadaceae bacterium]|nr:alpha/beta fold hydrolase [Gemmatimonadaceae bacterium]
MRYMSFRFVSLLTAATMLATSLTAQGRPSADTARAASRPDTARRAPPKDYSAPLGAPYTAQDVTIPTSMGHTLAGTLTLPNGASATSKVAAVVTMTGSGPQDRDETLTPLPGYRPFRQFADSLGRRGIAVLRMDDRGTGASKGNHATATSADFAEDIRAGLAYLRTRPEIDASRLGILGHSEGGLIGPLVAVKEPQLRAMALLAAPSWGGRKILEYQMANLTRGDTSLKGTRLDSALARIPTRIDSLRASNAWMKFFLDHDVLAVARQVKAPTLLLNGATDQQVTPEQTAELAAAIKSGGAADVTFRVFPDLNHLFIYDPVGFPRGYARLVRNNVEPEVIGVTVDWLVAKLK